MAETVHEGLQKAVGELRDSNKRFNSAVSDLSKSVGGLQNLGPTLAKDLKLDTLAGSLSQLPFSGLAASIGSAVFQKMRQRKEDKLLAKQLGLTTQQISYQRKVQETLKAREAQFSSLKDAAETLGFNSEKIGALSDEGIAQITRGVKQIARSAETRFASLTKDTESGAAAQEIAARQEKKDQQQLTTLEKIVDGISGLKDSLLKGLEKGAGMTFGVIAGLIAAPIIALSSFFSTLAVEFKALKSITKSIAGGKLFAPIRGLFSVMRTVFNASLSIQNSALKLLTKIPKIGGVFATIGDVLMGIPKALGAIAKGAKIGEFFAFIGSTIMRAVNFVKGIFTPVINFFKTLTTFTGAASGAFSGIAKFAAGFGRVLGKIFLPITILMSAFDFITGFMDGFDEGGILGGLEGGLSKVFANLIGMPLDLLKSAVSWIAGVFGFDGVSAALDSFSFSQLITDMIGGIFDGVSGIFTFLGDLFDFSDLTLFEGFLKLVDLVFLPVNLAINFVKGLFGWGGEDEGESFSLATFVTDKIAELIDFFMSFVDFDVAGAIRKIPGAGAVMDFLGLGGEDEEESVTTPSQTIRQNDSRIAELEDQIARSNAGENVFWGRDAVGRDEAQAEIDRLRAESIEMERFAREQNRLPVEGVEAESRSQTTDRIRDMGFEGEYQPAPINVVYNNSPNNSVNTTNPTTPLPVGVTDRSTAWQAAGSF